MDAPKFIEYDPQVVEAEAIATYEAALGKPVLDSQVERLFVNGAAYREALIRFGIQYAAEQNLVNYAGGENLDQLGALLSVPRLSVSSATATVEFTRDTDTGSLLVPEATQVSSGDLVFLTTDSLTITGLTGQTIVQALEPGIDYNGLAVGAINTVIGLNNLSVSNLTVTVGGAAVENDERYRARIKLAPAQFSVAGPKDAYRFFALSADSTIVDATAISGGSIQVEVYVLTETGLPSAGILAAVSEALNDEKVRPLTDAVTVLAPSEVTFDITVEVTALSSFLGSEVNDNVRAAAEQYAAAVGGKIGVDVVRSQIVAALSVAGVYSVAVTSPAIDLVLSDSQWANVGSISVTVTGEQNG